MKSRVEADLGNPKFKVIFNSVDRPDGAGREFGLVFYL